MESGIGLGLVYRIARDSWGHLTKSKRRLTPTDRVRSRDRWEDAFKSKLSERRREGLRPDVIIRDVARVDTYPDIEDDESFWARLRARFRGPRISPWFRVGLLDTYHRGILLGLDHANLAQDEAGEWHFPAQGQKETVRAVLAGYVRYENIERVQWDGDEYYQFPHIYCHFDEKGRMPYEKLALCERRKLEPMGWVYYSELAERDDVARASKLKGTSQYYPPSEPISQWSEEKAGETETQQ